MEENVVIQEDNSSSIDYTDSINSLLENDKQLLESLNPINSINDNLKFLRDYFEITEEEQKIIDSEKQEEIKENELLKQEEEKQEEKQEEEMQTFYKNIETIATSTDSQIANELLTDVSSLLQVTIIVQGILLGVICVSLLAKFFKK